jgi:hypothetical protein
MSGTVITGKLRPNRFPVTGFSDDGPVVPAHPPTMLELITK